jgi:small-conductance mechanosensitive channel
MGIADTMTQYLDPQFYISWFSSHWQKLLEHVLNANTLLEVSLITFALVLGQIIARPSIKGMNRLLETREWRNRFPGRLLRAMLPLLTIVLSVLLLRIGIEAFERYDVPTFLISTTARLLTAWFIIRFTTTMIRDSNWARLISITAWFVAALHILKLLVPAIELLDKLAIDLGGVRISLLLLIKGVIVFTVLLKLATTAASMLEKRILTIKELTPSVQVLLSKALTLTLLTVAIMVALSSLGINLSAFAFIGGAIGVGIGFGLQKVVSNLISGVILLLDKSIKPGDVIEVGDSYGRIDSLGARYVSVATRDGFEFLIPNEDLITQQVINWSFSNALVRIKIGVGVSYDTDIHHAMELMVQTASGVDRVLKKPGPVCQLKNFGDNAIDLELRIWIGDPGSGVSNVSSAVRVAIWDVFKEHGIEIPYPQRDVHILGQQKVSA